MKRAASAVRKAAASAFAFEPLAKEEGEKRVLILMADGSEEMETVIVYDILVRASLQPTLVSVSPQFSPSQSLPVSCCVEPFLVPGVGLTSDFSASMSQYVTLSRGAKMMADTQFETLKQEHKDDFDAIVRARCLFLWPGPLLTPPLDLEQIIPGGAKGAE